MPTLANIPLCKVVLNYRDISLVLQINNIFQMMQCFASRYNYSHHWWWLREACGRCHWHCQLQGSVTGRCGECSQNLHKLVQKLAEAIAVYQAEIQNEICVQWATVRVKQLAVLKTRFIVWMGPYLLYLQLSWNPSVSEREVPVTNGNNFGACKSDYTRFWIRTIQGRQSSPKQLNTIVMARLEYCQVLLQCAWCSWCCIHHHRIPWS